MKKKLVSLLLVLAMMVASLAGCGASEEAASNDGKTEVKAGFIALLKLTLAVLETCIQVLGFEAPERM